VEEFAKSGKLGFQLQVATFCVWIQLSFLSQSPSQRIICQWNDERFRLSRFYNRGYRSPTTAHLYGKLMFKARFSISLYCRFLTNAFDWSRAHLWVNRRTGGKINKMEITDSVCIRPPGGIGPMFEYRGVIECLNSISQITKPPPSQEIGLMIYLTRLSVYNL